MGMGMARKRRNNAIAVAVVGLAVAAVVAIVALPGGEPEEPSSTPVLICIDSTESTDDVREEYEEGLEKLVRQIVRQQGRILIDTCGDNATGEVDWPIKRRFRLSGPNDYFREGEATQLVKQVIEGTEKQPGIASLLEVTSKETTPIGEMLAAMARQCPHEGGECDFYMFTDGEWADEILRVKDGVDERERRRYLDTYSDELEGFAGNTVNFIGVGLGTEIPKTSWLGETKEITEELIEAAGGEVGDWAPRY